MQEMNPMGRLITTEPPPTPVEQSTRRSQWIIRAVLLVLILWLIL
jgi:hypothetical protein